MLRILTIAIFIATLGMAGVLYKIKYDTRSLQLDSVRLRQDIAVEKQQLAVLKAEWSILTQPARIEKLAQSLKLKQLAPKQIISSRDVDGLPYQKDGQQFADASDEDDALETFSTNDLLLRENLSENIRAKKGAGRTDLIGDFVSNVSRGGQNGR